MARTKSLRLVEPTEDKEELTDSVIDVGEQTNVELKDGILKIENPDGSITIDTNPDVSDKKSKGHYDNLSKNIDDSRLSEIAQNILDGIQRDEDSRSEWMQMRRKGIVLLGLKLEEPSDTAGSSSAPLEGQSRIRHPMLLEATVRFQATARGELLPSTGPVKIRNDTAIPPKPPDNMPPMDNTPGGIGHNGGPSMDDTDDLADSLEKDFNHYLTAVATEYVPDTDRMLFYIGFGGDGFKKVFNCPLRRRPVSESVDAEDLIVSNSSTDLQNCGRVTHKIKMRKSVLKRMQIIGAYRDVTLGKPSPPKLTPVELEKKRIEGISASFKKPEDEDYTVYECYTELDLDEFAPKKFKGKGLPLPYRVTVEKDSRQVLSIIRNWKEDDEECHPKRYFVQFPFVRGLGFYGLGYIHILGNMTNTLTAAWREIIDAGMFASFPGFLYSKQVGRQLTNQIRIPPGGGMGIELGAQQDIRAAIMPLPYQNPGAGHVAFVQHVAEEGQRLASATQINVGEGKQDAPVGTTLALIEQATKILDSVHKRLHSSQSEEFALLKERFKEDPEAFWRHDKTVYPWQKEQFLKALNDYNLVPVADPNNPTAMHRMAKANLVKQLATASPQLYNVQKVDSWIMRTSGINPEGLFNKQPTPPPPDPRMIAIQQKSQQVQMQVQAQLQQAQQQLQVELMKVQNSEQERQSREKIAHMKLLMETIRLQEEQIMHQADFDMEKQRKAIDMMLLQAKHFAESEKDQYKARHGLMKDHVGHQHEILKSQEQHDHDLEIARRTHEQEMAHTQERHQVDLENTKAIGRAKAAAARKMPKGKK